MSERFVDITDDDPGQRGRWSGWLSGPPGRLMLCLVAINAGLTVTAHLAPGSYYTLWLVSTACWLAVGLTLVIRAGIALATSGWSGLRGRWARWVAVPAAVAVTGVLVLSGAPVRAGLATARATMIEFAQRPDAPAPERAGVYRIALAERLDGGGARFRIEGSGLLNGTGFAYSPYTAPPRIGEDRYEHLGGPWYAWTESW